MKNEFGAMKTVRDLILRGYGYTQMLEKADLTEEDLSKLCTSYSDFNNEIIKRYKRNLALQKETVNETVSSSLPQRMRQECSPRSTGKLKIKGRLIVAYFFSS